MEYGVVILNYNNYLLTQSCVESLLNFIGDNLIVVVDNKSTNNSYQVLKECFFKSKNVIVINSETNNGYAAGNNIGLNYIKENYENIQYYIIMNPDVKIDSSDTFEKLIDHMKYDSDIACISPLMVLNGILDLKNCFWSLPDNTTIFLNWLSLDNKRKEKNVICYRKEKYSYVDVVPGSCFMIRKKFFDLIGKLDENTFLYNEEILLAHQVKKHGMKNAVSLDAFYHHNHTKGKRKNLKSKLRGLKIANASRLYLCKKYYSKLSYVILKVVCGYLYSKIIIKHLLGNVLLFMKGSIKNE